MIRVLIALVLVGLAQAPGRYPFDAAGRPVRIDQAWELRQPADGTALDIFFSLARCGRDIFISDTQSTIFRVDAGQPSSALARFAGDAQGLGRPTALTADCAGRRLYVANMGPRNIVVLDTTSGRVLSTHPYRRELFYPNAIVLVAPGIVHTGGWWVPDYLKRPVAERQPGEFFDRTMIGARVALDSGLVLPGLSPYETRCAGANACQGADLDAIGEGASRGWIASQAISTRVALYDASGKRTSTFDIRSPKFVRDTTEIPIKSPITVIENWRARNSVIRRVFAMGRHLVVAHSRTIIGPKWVAGEPPQLEVFMNIYDASGAPLVSDVRLPDLPIGRDQTHLYAIDYGPAGRGNAPEKVRLVRIPIATGKAIVQ